MTDKELLEQAYSLPPVYVDGFGAFRKINGVLRCIGFIMEGGAQLNLIVSLAGADQAHRDTRRTLHEEPTGSMHIWSGHELAH